MRKLTVIDSNSGSSLFSIPYLDDTSLIAVEFLQAFWNVKGVNTYIIESFE